MIVFRISKVSLTDVASLLASLCTPSPENLGPRTRTRHCKCGQCPVAPTATHMARQPCTPEQCFLHSPHSGSSPWTLHYHSAAPYQLQLSLFSFAAYWLAFSCLITSLFHIKAFLSSPTPPMVFTSTSSTSYLVPREQQKRVRSL